MARKVCCLTVALKCLGPMSKSIVIPCLPADSSVRFATMIQQFAGFDEENAAVFALAYFPVVPVQALFIAG